MGKKFEELKSLINAFGGAVDPTDDTVADLISKLVKVACKSYKITANRVGSQFIVDQDYEEIKKAVESGEELYLQVKVNDGAYEYYDWVSYVDYIDCKSVVFSRIECDDNEIQVKTMYINADGSTEYYERTL